MNKESLAFFGCNATCSHFCGSHFVFGHLVSPPCKLLVCFDLDPSLRNNLGGFVRSAQSNDAEQSQAATCTVFVGRN